MTKPYDARLGIKIDSDFTAHLAKCARCCGFDEKPASLVALCLEGSLLWKRENEVGGKRVRDRPSTWRSKDELKRVMKFK